MGKDILHRVGNGGHCGCETVSREVLPQVEIPEKWTQGPPCFAITIWCAIKIAHQTNYVQERLEVINPPSPLLSVGLISHCNNALWHKVCTYFFWCTAWKPCSTHWGRVMHIYISKLTTIGSDNGLLPHRRQAIIWTSAGMLLVWPLGTNLNRNLYIFIQGNAFENVVREMGEILSRPQCVVSESLFSFKFHGQILNVCL